MKISKLLNKYNFSIFLILFFCSALNAEEQPVDIWNLDSKNQNNSSSDLKILNDKNNENESISESDIYKMQTQKKESSIELDEDLKTTEIKIFGLYDPDDYSLDINMWTNSNGDKLKKIFSKLNKINL